MSRGKNVVNKPDFEIDLVQKVSEVFLGSRDFKKLADESVHLITSELRSKGVLGAAIFRANEKEGYLDAYAYSARAFSTVERILPAKFSQLRAAYTDTGNLLIKALMTNEVQEGTQLRDFAYPVLEHQISDAIQKAIGLSHILAFPLRLRSGKADGVLLIGLKNDEPTPDQRIVLETFRLQLELAFENVTEFEKLLERYRRNMAKAHERTHEEDIPTVRFTLRITPKQNRLLEKKAREEGVDKTTLIRSLIGKLGGSKSVGTN